MNKGRVTRGTTWKTVPRCLVTVGSHPQRGSHNKLRCLIRNRETLRLGCCAKAETLAEQSVVQEEDAKEKYGKYVGKKAVVVGAGPAGGMAAAFLAKDGFDVTVFEQRDDPTMTSVPGNRSNLIFLRSRTVDAMREIGVELPSEPGIYQNNMHLYLGTAILMNGRKMLVESMMDPARPGFQAERSDIAMAILSAIRSRQDRHIAFHFNHKCTDVDFDERRISFEDSDGRQISTSYDLLIAADGVHSRIRQVLQEFDETLNVQSYESTRGYRALRNLTFLDEKDPFMQLTKPGWHVLVPPRKTRHTTPQSKGAYLSLYQLDNGAMHGLLVAALQFFKEIEGHEEAWAHAALPSDFPKTWKEEIAQQLRETPYTRISTVHIVSKLCGPRTILLGDSGHSVTPSLSIGANMAITDGKALHEALETADGDLDAVAQIFDEQRRKDIHHFQTLQMVLSSFGVQVPRKYRILRALGKIHTLCYTLGHLILPWLIPMQVAHRFQYEWITAEEALNILKRDALIAATSLMAVLFFIAKRFLLPALKRSLSHFGIG